MAAPMVLRDAQVARLTGTTFQRMSLSTIHWDPLQSDVLMHPQPQQKKLSHAPDAISFAKHCKTIFRNLVNSTRHQAR